MSTPAEAATCLTVDKAVRIRGDGKTTRTLYRRKTLACLSWKAHKVVVKRKDLASQVESFRQQLARRDLIKEFAEPTTLLLKPAERNSTANAPCHRARRAVVELPFQALQNTPQRYLAEDHAISLCTLANRTA